MQTISSVLNILTIYSFKLLLNFFFQAILLFFTISFISKRIVTQRIYLRQCTRWSVSIYERRCFLFITRLSDWLRHLTALRFPAFVSYICMNGVQSECKLIYGLDLRWTGLLISYTKWVWFKIIFNFINLIRNHETDDFCI